ncbi:tyrosyl-DNA phosphodiesterase-domain-containing protein [Emericellopsis atlantica]|uniref:Tyrosyl-DNA phosphodiesterase-domain-containing protein n=1 Tax=Emericellopsis atlantica TaxID=2614577 RepID=A0A9P7ZL01_9HYPO|nr:tyrosyl-DNA phosphodiesterase-domain-containing protein [Emericellopsis atlantica]KAG9253413.1 tyrosyl-DNA phosphodiesterase-domain-containing protein [Emericellopsis atlantica]
MDRTLKRGRDDGTGSENENLSSLSRPISPPGKRQRAASEATTTSEASEDGTKRDERAPEAIRGAESATRASPWQLTWIRDLPEDLNRDAVTLKDLLGDPLISHCWEFNFLHDIDFLMDAFDPDIRHLVNVHVVHGFWKQEDPNRLRLVESAEKRPNVHLHTAYMPEMFGTHHSKMMILFRHDETAQVIIHTANMIPKDWTNMTNAVWRSPSLPFASQPTQLQPECTDNHPLGSGERFKADLMHYLRAYNQRRKVCNELVDRLCKHDFSAIRAAFIASVPGQHNVHDTDHTSWGWAALRRNLRNISAVDGPSEIVVQISSIATLGGKDDWLQKTLFESLSKTATAGVARPRFRVVFPTADEIRDSLDGYASGGSIHTKIQSPQQAKQLQYLRPIFCHWGNDSANGKALPANVPQRKGGRARAAPHIKTYIRYNAQGAIDWALLTSANLSKQAWGDAERNGIARISSWEVGVLVWPDLVEQQGSSKPSHNTPAPGLNSKPTATKGNVGREALSLSDRGFNIYTYSSSGSNANRHILSSSFRASSPLAEQYLAADLANCSSESDEQDGSAIDDDGDEDDDFLDSEHHDAQHHFMYRRASGVAYGGSRPVLNIQEEPAPPLTAIEQKISREAERSILRDNHVLPPKHRNQPQSQNPVARMYRHLFSTKLPVDEEAPVSVPARSRETDPLLGAPTPSTDDNALDYAWEAAVASGKLKTTWQRETKTLAEYSAPLTITFFLQYSINVASIFAVGRLGKAELGAVSVANMTVAISCLAPFQGLATSLDTLCAQAYGSGHKHLVGLQCQRMACFLFTLMLPVALLWTFSTEILMKLIPEPESARLAGLYLKVMIAAIPGIILFECGKRFTQAQGLFRATTHVAMIAAPLNVLLLWLFVWKLDMGFIGAPISVAIVENVLPLLLFLWVRFVDGRQCWGGFTRRALQNWWVMVRLALPGMVMVEAEWMAFEIMTLLASRFGSEYLAAQSAVATLGTIAYQLPFPVSIAASTRIANLIGAGMVDSAKTAGKVAVWALVLIGLFNFTVFYLLRYKLPLLFTSDAEVVDLCARVLPVVAFMQVVDGLSAGAHGLLRGIGKQAIGGPANLIAYYGISLPISLGLAFGLDWRLEGLWVGVSIGLVAVSLIEYLYLYLTSWDAAAAEAEVRNNAG